MQRTIARCWAHTEFDQRELVSLDLEGLAGLLNMLEREFVVRTLAKAGQERRALGRASVAQEVSERCEHGVLGALGLEDFGREVGGESAGSWNELRVERTTMMMRERKKRWSEMEGKKWREKNRTHQIGS